MRGVTIARCVAAPVAGLAAMAAGAHAGGAPVPGAEALTWAFEPWVLACLAVSGGLYAVGVARLWRRAGRGHGLRASHVAAFAAGWLSLVVALVSPLDPLGARLFSAHMMQHEVLMVVAAPLLVLGRPLAAWAWALPRERLQGVGALLRRPGWRAAWAALTRPLSAWSLHAIALWGWHLPAAFEAALRHPGIHVAQHASFLGTALLFWWSTLGATRRHEQGYALASLFTTMCHTGALGALMSLSPLLWYPSYAPSSAALGIDPLDDQQLGGLIMWIPAGAAYLLGALWLVAGWLRPPRPASSADVAVHGLPSTAAPSTFDAS